METAVTLDFADGSYRFWLPLPQALELERNCGKSLFTIFDQVASGLGLIDDKPVYATGGAAMVKDIRETIRLGLIGGNSAMVDGEEKPVGPQTAKQLVDDYVYPARPLIEGQYLAWGILKAAIEGVQLKKKAEPVKAKPRSRSAKARSSPTAEA